MSFAGETKKELCRVEDTTLCCETAECYGLLLFAKHFSNHEISVSTEQLEIARRLSGLIVHLTNTFVDVTQKFTTKNNQRTLVMVSVPSEDQREAVLCFFGHEPDEVARKIHFENFSDSCCAAAFLRGVFLSCGTVTNPEKEYHLEFVVPSKMLADGLVVLIGGIEELEISPAITNRKGNFVVYVKGSEGIENLLTYMGAQSASMEFMQVKMLKEVRNLVNRKTNFETANIDKTVTASSKQVEAIHHIMRTVGITELPEDLQEIATLRYENPEMSLRELGAELSKPISRSGVNHRLKRLLAFAEELR